MATCRDIIRKALRYCGDSTQYSEASNESYADGLDQLNRLVNTWYEQGLQLGDTESEYTSINDAFGYPLFAQTAFEFNLGLLLWPLINPEKDVPATLYNNASRTENELFTLAGASVTSVFPGNLPKGAGNWSVGDWNYYPNCDEPMYNDCSDQVITEKNAPIITENNNE